MTASVNGAPSSRVVGDNTPGVKVVTCWHSDPLATYILTPIVKFWIATGGYSEGQSVLVSEIGNKVPLDFTTQGENVFATTTHNSDGTYSPPQFSPTPPTK
jgi:hypothetical protein